MRRRPLARAFLIVAAAAVLAAGCGGSGGGNAAATQAATATTFVTDAVVTSAMATMVIQAHTATLLASSGHGSDPAAACASAWRSVRDKVASRDPQRAATLDRAVDALVTSARARDVAAASDAAATIAATAASYARLFP